MEKIGDENELQSISQKRKLNLNGNSGMAGAVYSPKNSTVTSKSKPMKKASSSLQHGY